MAHLFAYKVVFFNYHDDEEQFSTAFGMVAAEIDTLAAAVAEVEKNWGVDEIFEVNVTRVYDGCGTNVDVALRILYRHLMTLVVLISNKKERRRKRKND